MSEVSSSAQSDSQSDRLVWDLPVRLVHWALLLAVLGAWLTRELEGDWFAWHTRFGYAVAILASWRVLWGFVGTRHARFANFVRGPSAVLRYLRERVQPAGHNPLGAVGVVLMLGLLLAQAGTGLFANDQVFETGPLFGYVEVATSDRLTTIHKQVFDVLVVVIGVHVLAVFAHLFLQRDNLIRPMITGRKPSDRVPSGEQIDGSRLWLAGVLLAGLVGTLAMIVTSAPEASLFVF